MTGIIFAAGIGSRLKPFTDYHPKALAPVGGVPNIVHVAKKLLTAGVDNLIVNVHHFPEQVIDCIEKQSFSADVAFSDESARLLDTGGALAKIDCEKLSGLDNDDFVIVHNADIYTDFPISEMIEQHKALGADATILVDAGRASSRQFLFNGEGTLRGWRNNKTVQLKPSGLDETGLSAAAFGGVHILSGKVLHELGLRGIDAVFSITDWYLENCNRLCIKGYTPSAGYRWHDIGTTEKLAAANADLIS